MQGIPAPLRVLVAEDNPTSGTILSACIQRARCTPIGPATTVAAALDLFELTAPAAIIIDVQLADGGDGIALAQTIRDRSAVPIIFVTGTDDTPTFERAQRVRPVEFFYKAPGPAHVSADAVARRAAALLGGGRARSQPGA